DATRDMFHEGWLCTGDLAYLVDGELVICGRIKDVIIVGGRNVFPEDIERAVGRVEGVRAGNVIAFGVEGYKGKESVVVVAEVKSEDLDTVRHAVHSAALEVSGLPPRDVMLVRPGTLPKTSSGKLQRAKCRETYLAGELDVVSGG
ncbi:MAG: fatty-acid--CoA ligase, partial [Actinomycetota bacterium]